MPVMRQQKLSRVNESGAPAGSVLTGCGPNNQGLRVQIEQVQAPGEGGPLHGRFVILDAGVNLHTEQVNQLLRRSMDAAEVLGLIRQRRPACVNVVNANALTVEGTVSHLPTTAHGLPVGALTGACCTSGPHTLTRLPTGG